MMERLERSLSRFAVPGLIRYIVALNALVFILVTLDPGYVHFLELNPTAILRGEVWRVVSWIFLPETQSFFWIIFYLMFTWWLGDLLEASWGTFRMNAYYLLGMALCIGSALIFGASGGNLFLNLSLFLAVATLAPDLEILLFLVIPMKIKWVALFSLIYPAYTLLFGPLAEKMGVIMCLGNYLIFFAPAYFQGTLASHKIRERRQRFEAAKLGADAVLHTCAVCGASESSHPDTEFRVSSDGNEYCTEHLPVRRTNV